MRWYIVACVCTFIVTICGSGSTEALWQAGVARRDITPKEPMWLAGYAARDHESTGTIHELWAKALVLKDAEARTAVMISSDIIGFSKPFSDAVRDRLKKEYGLDRPQVLLNSSHTHSGPMIRETSYGVYPVQDAHIARAEQYTRVLEDQIVGVVGDALAAIKPARLSAGNGVTRFAVNRRTNKEAEILSTYALQGPNDHAVPVIKVDREDGTALALVFGYACHSTVLDGYEWCGDYPGFAQREIEAAFPSAMAMFFAGCGADQNPLPRRTVALARQYGRELAAAVSAACETGLRPLSPALGMEYAETNLDLQPLPTREALAAWASSSSGYVQRCLKDMLADLDAGKPLPTKYPYPVQVWRLGDQCVVALGGEVVVEYAMYIKNMLGANTAVFGYSNDVMAYIPSLRVLREGGYEGGAQVGSGFASPWAETIESKVLDTVRALAEKTGSIPAL